MLINFKPVLRDSLFYDQWQYSVSGVLPMASCLRHHNFGKEKILELIAKRKSLEEVRKQFGWARPNEWISSPSAQDDENKLLEVAAYLSKVVGEFKLVAGRNYFWLYANNTKIIQDLIKFTGITHSACSVAVIERPKNTIRLKNSQYTFRTYFKNKKVSSAEHASLGNFLKLHPDHIRISPGLKLFLKNNYTYLSEHYFIDYSDESWLLMLSLINSKIVRKTVNIIKD